MKLEQLRNPLSLVCGAAALLLFAALLRYPYGVYRFVHLVVCIAGGYVTWIAYRARWYVVAVIYCGIALFFNPIFPIHLTRAVWHPIDVICGIAFVGAAVIAPKMLSHADQQVS